MYLAKLLIINYRSCRCVELDVCKDEPNILIGINDCGKTSLLKGLELLLCEKPQVFCVKDGAKKKDISNTTLSVATYAEKFAGFDLPAPLYTGNEIIVVGKFIVEDEDYADPDIQQIKPHPQWALENASEGGLWFCRTFNEDGRMKQFLLTPDTPIEGEPAAFFSLSATQLSKKRTEHRLTPEDISNSNGAGRFSNLEIARALYTKLGSNQQWVEWKWEKGLLPSFRYLDWNSSFDAIMESATEALSDLMAEHLTPVKELAREAAQRAESILNDRLMFHSASIAALLPQVQRLSANVHFEVKEKITDLLITKLGGDGPVHMDLQGDGIKRQIWFALVKSAAMAGEPTTRKKFIWAFDEPETHLYPTAQRQLFEVINQVSKGSIQTLISTHSTIFVDKAKLNAIKLVNQTNSYTSHLQCDAIDSVFISLGLRNSDFLFHDRFLVVEGDTEEHLIPILYKMYTGRTLPEDNIQLIVLKGASNWRLQKIALENVFNGFQKSAENLFYLLDSDQKASLGATAITDNMHFVGKQDLEDAIPSEVWAKISAELFPPEVAFAIEDIDLLKGAIPDSGKAQNHEKFMHIFTKEVRRRADARGKNEVFTIPHKGSELANAILEYLACKELIPRQIGQCFDKLAVRHPVIEIPLINEEEASQPAFSNN